MLIRREAQRAGRGNPSVILACHVTSPGPRKATCGRERLVGLVGAHLTLGPPLMPVAIVARSPRLAQAALFGGALARNSDGSVGVTAEASGFAVPRTPWRMSSGRLGRDRESWRRAETPFVNDATGRWGCQAAPSRIAALDGPPCTVAILAFLFITLRFPARQLRALVPTSWRSLSLSLSMFMLCACVFTHACARALGEGTHDWGKSCSPSSTCSLSRLVFFRAICAAAACVHTTATQADINGVIRVLLQSGLRLIWQLFRISCFRFSPFCLLFRFLRFLVLHHFRVFLDCFPSSRLHLQSVARDRSKETSGREGPACRTPSLQRACQGFPRAPIEAGSGASVLRMQYSHVTAQEHALGSRSHARGSHSMR